MVLSLFVPAAATANAAGAPPSPTPQTITGIVQTIIREQSPEQRAAANVAAAADPSSAASSAETATNDTSKVLRVGTATVPLTDGSLAATKDGTKVSVEVLPASDGDKRVLSATTISTPAASLAGSTLAGSTLARSTLAGSTVASSTVAAASTVTGAAASPSAHHLYVALVLPATLAADPSITEASTRTMVSTVSRYWSSQTGGLVSFDIAQIRPIYRSAIACSGTNGNSPAMWAEALGKMSAAAAGAGNHLVVVAPGGASDFGCSYGLGTIGGVNASGNEVFVSGLDQSLLAHELGHNLGLYHSNSLRCNGIPDMPVVGALFPTCQANPYDDLFDVMGFSGPNYGEGNLNAVHLNGMGLLPASVRRIPATAGLTTVRITPLSAPLSATTVNRTVKITDPSGARYFVEYRTNSGRDAAASHTWDRPSYGVRVLRDDPSAPASAGSYELDATPTSLLGDDYNRSLPVGGTFTSASRRLTVRVGAQDASGATLVIAVSGTRIVPAKVTQAIPARASVGAAVTATTKVTDQHGWPVTSWPVTLQKMSRGTATWPPVKSLITSSTGAASYRFVNGVSGYYRWVTSPATGALTKVSPPVAVTSIARVVERRPATSVARRWYLSITGSVSSVPAPVIFIQYRYGNGPWRTGPRVTVRGTAVSGRIALSTPGIAYTRLYVRSAASYLGSTSSPFATRVR